MSSLYGWSVVVAMISTWWPLTRYVYQSMEATSDWIGYPAELARGAGAAGLGFVLCLMLALFWPVIMAGFLIGHAVSRAAAGRRPRVEPPPAPPTFRERYERNPR